MTLVKPLPVEALYREADPAQFTFETTRDLPDLNEIIGQPRAVAAVRFGMGIGQEGYNLFALGPAGTGKRALVVQFFEERARSEPPPPDWIYVHNFEHDYRPNAIQLPAGRGAAFQRAMGQLVEELRTAIVAAFESEEYRARRRAVEEELQEQQEQAFEAIQQRAQQSGLALMRTPAGIVFAPIKDGEVLPPEQFQNLPVEERERLEKMVGELQTELQAMLQRLPGMQRAIRARVRALNRETATFASASLIAEIRQQFEEFQEIRDYLEAVQKDILENVGEFLPQEEPSGDVTQNPLAALMARARQEGGGLKRYQVNLFVDNQGLKGAPVIIEDNPTYQNLVGRVDHLAQFGALTTDFTLVKPGALHRANGGYLILDVRKVLGQSFAWEGLKRALQSHQVQVESLGQMLSLVSTISLEPEPIPLRVKVALCGDRNLYYLLSSHDPDFAELFKVQADFEEHMPRQPETQAQYAQLLATLIRRDQLPPFDRAAVARLIEHSARMVSDSEKLSIQVREVVNLLHEAGYWAEQNDRSVVSAEDVQQAIDAQIYRADRLRERFQESILRETVFIATSGAAVGQVNGLSVLQLGNFSFAVPSRITARLSLGKGDVVNIEREVDLSGPIHSKGVLILAGFLRGRFGQERPLSFNASLVFEQSYSNVDGDSASSAELYALLSALAGAPIRQSLAVTGSVNQFGQVQPIGGVNEKIEGFFDICRARGLTGDQGVLIPAANVKHLMLRHDLRAAVAAEQFAIYPIEHVDQGIEMLTGLPAGEPDESGAYPPESLNGQVQARLEQLQKKSREHSQPAKEGQA
jgi:lon-related putative ATP-dependent protease